MNDNINGAAGSEEQNTAGTQPVAGTGKIPDRVAALEERTAKLEAVIKRMLLENALFKKLASGAGKPPEKPVIPTDTFSVDGVTYKFVAASFRHKNQVMTATDALADTAILEKLVSSGSALIKRVD
jgi:hypothetical protein